MEYMHTGGVSPPGRIGRVALGDVLHRSSMRFGDKVVLTEGEAQISYGAFCDALQGQPDSEPEVEINDRDLALIIYTSGTTSRPKGAMHCHLAIVMAAIGNAIEWSLTPQDRMSGQLPVFHCAVHAGLMAMICAGGSLSLMRGFDPEVVIESISRDKLTLFVGHPMMYGALLDHKARRQFDSSSIRNCIFGLAPMGEALQRRVVAEFCRDLVCASGQIEMYPMTTCTSASRSLKRFGNYWGNSLCVTETAIMAENGTLLAHGEVGELVHRGPNVMLGFYRDPAATDAARAHGGYQTGALALIDDFGEVLFIDRMKDMIKTGGENIASSKVEAALASHMDVAMVAVVGLPHPRWSEAVAAFVVLKPGAAVLEDALLTHARKTLGGFQVPKLLKLVAAIPMTATGKLRKVELRHAHQDHFDNAAGS